MRGKSDRKNNKGDVVIRKEEVVEGGHHGGAWKVAYADFVTAMMAFFLLMWLLNATTEDQRKGLADYFSPNNLLSHASSGTGDPFGGHTAFDDGALVSDRGAVQVAEGKRPVLEDAEEGQAASQNTSGPNSGRAGSADHPPAPTAPAAKPQPQPPPAGVSVAGPGQGSHAPTEAEIKAEQERQEKAAFEQAAQQIRDAVRNDPALAVLAKQLAIDMTPEGLRIQILDQDNQPMFTTGSAIPNDWARLLLEKVTPVLLRLPQQISISGHTDAAQYPGPDRTNWELSTERANATRRLLVETGLPDTRISTVTGHADHDLLLPADPLAAANRRIAIVVLREAGTKPVAATSPSPPPVAAPVAPPAK
ncbi:MAG TPA: flagellar motor protein MotB [Acetobacteraceae bacterium]|jgi:chemotaxis protein MotB